MWHGEQRHSILALGNGPLAHENRPGDWLGSFWNTGATDLAVSTLSLVQWISHSLSKV
jgi:hypothetical protein